MSILANFIYEYFITHSFLAIIYTINFILAMGIIFIDKKEASATMAWIMILYLLPLVGIFMYFVFSQNIARSKVYRVQEGEFERVHFLLSYQIDMMNNDEFIYPSATSRKWLHMIRLNQRYGESLLTTNNNVELISDGKEKFERLKNDIRGAKHRISLMYFIIKDDFTGRELIDLLTEKAREGNNASRPECKFL